MNEVEILNRIGLWLVKQCIETNAETLTFTQEGVNHFGKPLGDWEITVKKLPKKEEVEVEVDE